MGNVKNGLFGSFVFSLGATAVLMIYFLNSGASAYVDIPPELTLILSFLGFFSVGMGLWAIQDRERS